MNKFVILTFGFSQVGKDTWIQTFLNVRTNPGQGYHGITNRAEIYSNQIGQTEYIVINVPGINDPNLRFDNQFILEQIQAILLENNLNQINAILLFESITEQNSIPQCLDQLHRLFGNTVVGSILVVGSKKDRAEILNIFEKRKVLIEAEAQRHGVQVIYWKNFEKEDQPISNEVRTAQIEQIIQKMAELTPYSVLTVKQIQEEIKQRAQTLMNTTPKATKYITVNYNETVQVPYQDIEYYTEDYQDVETYYENRTVKRVRTVQKQETKTEIYYVTEGRIIGDQWCGGISGLFGNKKPKYGDVQVPKTRQIKVTVDVPEEYEEVVRDEKKRTVWKIRQKKRYVTKYTTKVEYKSKQQLVEIPHDFNVFYERVKQQRVEEIKQQIRNGIEGAK